MNRPAYFPARPATDTELTTSPSWVAPYLLVGPIPPAGHALARNGIHVLVLAAVEWQPHGNNFPGVTVVHAGIDDSFQPTVRDAGVAYSTAHYVVTALHAGRTVLITCAMGRNRSALMAALALRLGLGLTSSQAIHAVRTARGPMALSNTAFVKLIERLPLKR